MLLEDQIPMKTNTETLEPEVTDPPQTPIIASGFLKLTSSDSEESSFLQEEKLQQMH